jgi:hypothetical protein
MVEVDGDSNILQVKQQHNSHELLPSGYQTREYSFQASAYWLPPATSTRNHTYGKHTE